MTLFQGIDFKMLSQTKWEKLPDELKLRMLQQIENNIALIQNRNPRKLLYKREEEYIEGEYIEGEYIEGEYIFGTPEYIHLYKINDIGGIIETIIHEGTHALVDDAVLGKKDTIFLVSKIDSDILSEIVSSRGIIYNHFAHLGNKSIEFNLLYYEEQLARYESYIHFINGINSIPNEFISIKNELLNKVFLRAARYYIYCYKVEMHFGKYNDEERKISFEHFTDIFGINELFKVTNIDLSEIEQYFISMMKQILKNNGYSESIDIYPRYSSEVVDSIRQTKIKKYEYEQLPDETKYFINQIIYYQSHFDQIQNIAIRTLIYPVFANEIEKLGPDSKIYKLFHCVKGFGWTGYNIVESVKYAMNWKVEDLDLYQRVIAFYETKREEVEQFADSISIILSLYKCSPEFRIRFEELGVNNLLEFLGAKEHILMYGNVPNKYKRIKEQLGIVSTNPREITPKTITEHFLNSSGADVLKVLIDYIKQKNNIPQDSLPPSTPKLP